MTSSSSPAVDGHPALAGPCECYKCVGARYKLTDNGRVITNNLLRHTLLEPCEECGRAKTEYRDLGRKGYFVCWWCNHRTASTAPGQSEGWR